MSVPARDGFDSHVLEVLPDPIEVRVVENGAGRLDRAKRIIARDGMRLDTRLLQQLQVGGAGAEDRYLLFVQHFQERRRIRVGGGSVEHQDRHSRGERRDLPVPHHPAAGGMEIETVLRPEVGVQAMFLQMLEQRAAGAVHQAFRRARGAGGEQNEERVVERKPLQIRNFQGLSVEPVLHAHHIHTRAQPIGWRTIEQHQR